MTSGPEHLGHSLRDAMQVCWSLDPSDKEPLGEIVTGVLLRQCIESESDRGRMIYHALSFFHGVPTACATVLVKTDPDGTRLLSPTSRTKYYEILGARNRRATGEEYFYFGSDFVSKRKMHP